MGPGFEGNPGVTMVPLFGTLFGEPLGLLPILLPILFLGSDSAELDMWFLRSDRGLLGLVSLHAWLLVRLDAALWDGLEKELAFCTPVEYCWMNNKCNDFIPLNLKLLHELKLPIWFIKIICLLFCFSFKLMYEIININYFKYLWKFVFNVQTCSLLYGDFHKCSLWECTCT